MTRIVYKIVENKGEMRSFETDGTQVLTIDIGPRVSGHVAIGREVAPVTGGRGKIDLSHLNDGEYTPILYADSVITLEPIRREMGKILFPGTPDSTVRSLLVRCERLEDRVKSMSDRLDELLSLIGKEITF